MPGLETSMYHVPEIAQPQSPLDMMAKAAGIQNALNQNQLFQQTNRARITLGHIMQQSIDPDGQIDYNKAAVSLSQHPDTALIAPDIIGKWAQQKNLQLDNVMKSLTIAGERDKHFGDMASALVVRGAQGQADADASGRPVFNSVNQENVLRTMGQLDPAHVLDDKTKMDFAIRVGLPIDPKTGQPDYRAKWDGKLAWKNLTDFAQSKLGAAGNVKSATERLQATTAAGQPISAPAYGVPGAFLAGAPTGGASSGAAAAGGAVAPAGGGPGAAAPGAGGAPAAGPAGPGGLPGALQTGLDPMRAQQIKDLSEKYEPDLNDRTAKSQSLLNLIRESRLLAKDFTPGTGTGLRTKLAALMASVTGEDSPVVKRIMNGDVSSAQAFDKLAVQSATQAMSQVFSRGDRRTQEEWRRFQQAYPNLETTKGAMNKMYDFMSFNANMTKHESEAYNQWKGLHSANKVNIADFQNWWSNKAAPALSDMYWAAREKERKPKAQDRASKETP